MVSGSCSGSGSSSGTRIDNSGSTVATIALIVFSGNYCSSSSGSSKSKSSCLGIS